MNDTHPAATTDLHAVPGDRRPRVTVSVVCRRDDQFLLVEETVGGELVLNLPGGHLDPGETLIQAARREALEESGWQVNIDALVGIYQWRARHRNRRYVRFVFAADAVDPVHDEPTEPGIQGIHWKPLEELQRERDRLRSPVILTILEHYQAGQRFPLTLLGTVEPL